MRLSATAVTAGYVLLAYLVARYVGGVHLHSPGFSTMQHPAGVPAGFAVAIALVAALAGWGLVEALERRTAHPRRTWLITAPVVLLVSLGGPLSGHGVSAGGPPRAGPPAPHSRCRCSLPPSAAPSPPTANPPSPTQPARNGINRKGSPMTTTTAVI